MYSTEEFTCGHISCRGWNMENKDDKKKKNVLLLFSSELFFEYYIF